MAVCLWDSVSGVGGVHHFVLPHWSVSESDRSTSGAVSLQRFVEYLSDLGARISRVKAKVYGASGQGTGNRMGAVVLRFLAALNISVEESDLGGSGCREVTFNTWDGAASVKRYGSRRFIPKRNRSSCREIFAYPQI